MSSVQTIEVHTAPAYEVTIGAGLLRECGARLKAVLGGCRIAVVADSNVAPLYLETVCASLRDAGFAVCSYVFPAGEAHKNFTTLSAILEFLAESQLTRTDCVAALGGGVTGDMAGFAAASYLRGIRYVQLPTTLLSAVDSSVGGKTAIDLAAGKNLAGAFLQPAAVLCDTDCLRSLPAAVFADGAAEAIKTGVLSGETLFSLFEDGRLTDSRGRSVDFRNTVIIMTSNAGAKSASRTSVMGFGANTGSVKAEKVRETMLEELKRTFKPEFLNRVDEIVVFKPLEREQTLAIARLMLSSVAKRLRERGIELTVTDEATALISSEGFDPEYGARPLRRAIQQQVEDALSEEILSGRILLGDTVKMGVENGILSFVKQ